MQAATLTAGETARRAGISRKALRLYQAKGLIDEPARTAAGYQLYTDHHVEVLTFIRQARTLGLHLNDIATILHIHRDGAAPCAEVGNLIDIRVREIDAAIADLRDLRRALMRTRSSIQTTTTTDSMVCPVIAHTQS